VLLGLLDFITYPQITLRGLGRNQSNCVWLLPPVVRHGFVLPLSPSSETGLRHLIWPANPTLAQLEINEGVAHQRKSWLRQGKAMPHNCRQSRIENLAKKTRSRWFVTQITRITLTEFQ